MFPKGTVTPNLVCHSHVADAYEIGAVPYGLQVNDSCVGSAIAIRLLIQAHRP